MQKIKPEKRALIERQQDRISRELPELTEQLALTADEYLGSYGILLNEYLEESSTYLTDEHISDIEDVMALMRNTKAGIWKLIEHLEKSEVFRTMPRQLTDEEKAEIVQKGFGTFTITDNNGTSFTMAAETLKELLKQ